MKKVGLVVLVVVAIGWALAELLSTSERVNDVRLVERAEDTVRVAAPFDPATIDEPERVTPDEARPLTTPESTAGDRQDLKRVTFAVRDETNLQPIPGADVLVIQHDNEVARGTPDADGLVTFEVPAGDVFATATVDEKRLFGSTSGTVAETSETVEIVLLVAELATVTGVVRDGETGMPLADVRVSNHVSTSRAFEHVDVRSDERGQFEFPYVSISTVASLEFERVGYGHESLSIVAYQDVGWFVLTTEEPLKSLVPGGATLEVDLFPERRIVGRCVDIDGQPLVGEIVVGRGMRRESSMIHTPDQAKATTDVDGAFELTGLNRKVDHDVLVKADDIGFATSHVPAEASGDVGTLVVRPSIAIRGSVVDAKGRPVIGARVSTLALWDVEDVYTDRDGTFHITDVPGKSVSLTVWLGRQKVPRQHVDCTQAETIDFGVVQTKFGVTSVRGRILTTAGELLGASELVLNDRRGRASARGKTYGDGFFELSASAASRLEMFTLELLDANGDVRASWPVQVDDTSVTLEMP